MYEIDISTLPAYIGTMLSLVGGALKLDPAAFQAVFDHTDRTGAMLFVIVFIAGLSIMMGQSVVLFANRVTPGRFAVSLVLGALKFVIDVTIIVVVIWIMANVLGEKPWNFTQVARAIALVSAPYWLSITVLIPYLGLIIERVLKIYVYLALLVSVQTIFSIDFFYALWTSMLAIGLAHVVSSLLGRVLTPLAAQLTDAVAGAEEIKSTREIYEMFASRNQIAE
jgi:hypothetical protein